MKMAPIVPQGATLFGLVGENMSLEWALSSQKVKSGLVAHCLFLLPSNPDIDPQVPLQHHVYLTICFPP